MAWQMLPMLLSFCLVRHRRVRLRRGRRLRGFRRVRLRRARRAV